MVGEGRMYLLYRAASEALPSRTHQVLPGFRVRLQEHCFLAAGVQKRVFRVLRMCFGQRTGALHAVSVHVRRRGTGMHLHRSQQNRSFTGPS